MEFSSDTEQLSFGEVVTYELETDWFLRVPSHRKCECRVASDVCEQCVAAQVP